MLFRRFQTLVFMLSHFWATQVRTQNKNNNNNNNINNPIDHRKIHLKNSFRFYWIHINVSIEVRTKGLSHENRQNADIFMQPISSMPMENDSHTLHILCIYLLAYIFPIRIYSCKYSRKHSFARRTRVYVCVCVRLCFNKCSQKFPFWL